MKTCTKCKKEKDVDLFYRDSSKKDWVSSICKDCRKHDQQTRRIGKKQSEETMKEAQFNAIYNSLSSVHKKIYESVPEDTYWSATRIGGELFRRGVKQDAPSIKGILNYLVKTGVVTETDKGMFSRTPVSKIVEADMRTCEKPAEKECIVPKKETQSPFDALREIAIKFMDVAKSVNVMALDIDAKLSDIEKQATANEKDNEKLKQLQVLLKSLG